MADISKAELQWVLDGICKHINGKRNHLAGQLFQEMHRADCLGQYGHIYCGNGEWDIKIVLHRKTRSKK